MSENLNYSRNNTLGYCYGVDIDGENPHRDSTSCGNGYGRIYDYATAMDGNPTQGLCPNGWHIPSTEEWSNVRTSGGSNTPIMSSFCIYSGNYDLSGWKDRDYYGFYWTSSGNNYFTIFTFSSYSECYIAYQTLASATDSWSVRCVANDDFKFICGTAEYNPSTDFCSGTTLYPLCGGKAYDPLTQSCCDGKTTYNTLTQSCCGGKTYNTSTQSCCGTKIYNPNVLICTDDILSNHQITCNGGIGSNCNGKNTVTMNIDECVEIRVLGYANQFELITPVMRCSGSNQIYVTLALDGTTKTANGQYSVQVSLKRLELGDNDFGILCLEAPSNAAVTCTAPSY
jgi:uncharacterized protein (TIGR02145 family)